MKCNRQPLNNGYNDYSDGDDHYDEVMGRLVMDLEEKDEEINLDGQGEVKVWVCPYCHHVFKRHDDFKTHACTAHDISQNDIGENDFVERWKNRSKTGIFFPSRFDILRYRIDILHKIARFWPILTPLH